MFAMGCMLLGVIARLGSRLSSTSSNSSNSSYSRRSHAPLAREVPAVELPVLGVASTSVTAGEPINSLKNASQDASHVV